MASVDPSEVTSDPAPLRHGAGPVTEAVVWSEPPAPQGVSSMSEDAATPLLELRGVSKAFGAVQALSKVNLSIPAGKVTALVGDNGAGKSVTIKTISGLWEPSEGEIFWEGSPIRIHSPND